VFGRGDEAVVPVEIGCLLVDGIYDHKSGGGCLSGGEGFAEGFCQKKST
jgi:hypothetical protein